MQKTNSTFVIFVKSLFPRAGFYDNINFDIIPITVILVPSATCPLPIPIKYDYHIHWNSHSLEFTFTFTFTFTIITFSSKNMR